MNQSQGFSLLELMVALSIFAIIAVVAQRGMMMSMTSADRLSERSTDIAELQLAVSAVTRDLENAVGRTVRTGPEQTEPALLLEDDGRRLTFTRSGIIDPTGRARSPFQRVIYTAGATPDDAPQRGTWAHIDRPNGALPNLTPLDDEIGAISFLVFSEGQWVSTWPQADMRNPATLPDGIAVVFDTRIWGPVRRVVSYR